MKKESLTEGKVATIERIGIGSQDLRGKQKIGYNGIRSS
jgi:hypothetical protein